MIVNALKIKIFSDQLKKSVKDANEIKILYLRTALPNKAFPNKLIPMPPKSILLLPVSLPKMINGIFIYFLSCHVSSMAI